MTGLRWLANLLPCLALSAWCLTGLPLQAQPVDLARVEAAAEGGDAGAQRQLGELYRDGEVVVQNHARAARWFQAAADQGDAAAMNALAQLYASGLGIAADPARAFALFSGAAETGEAQYLHDLATAYEQGIGTNADPARAAELYSKAADLGLAESQVALGVLYQTGTGVAQDIARAIELYSGPAEAGHARAQNNLGLIYARGSGVEQDYAKAVKWLTLAAEQGLPVALRNLAVHYQNGFGVEADEAEALRLNRLAAELSGSGGALGLVFDPRLAPPDPALAQDYLASARTGDPVAQFLLGYLIASNAQSGTDLRTAAGWFHKAADAGMAGAMANLGVLTFEGKGALQDFVEGYRLLTLAASAGLPGAAGVRDRMTARMTPDQINAATAAAEATWAARTGGAD